MNLTRETIVATAMKIMDAYGLGDLSMRRLAAALNVQPSALYWHYPNKQALLAAVAAAVLIDVPPFDGRNWSISLRTWAVRLYEALRQHRSGAEVVSSALALSRWEDGPGAQIERELASSGIDPELAKSTAVGVLYLVLGYAFDVEQRAQAAALGVTSTEPGAEPTTTLDEAIALLVAGLQATNKSRYLLSGGSDLDLDGLDG